jgi:NAD(P)H-nitrite reductase large subunit
MVSKADIEEAIAEGNLTVNDIKRRTRAGMGICQGIYCNAAVARMLKEHGVSQGNLAPMTARPPMRMINLSVAAESVAGEGN